MKCSICKSEMYLGNICPKCSVDEKSSPRSDCCVSCIEFVEWVNRQNIYQRNNKTWVKDNPLFDKVVAKDTNELYKIFCEKEGTQRQFQPQKEENKIMWEPKHTDEEYRDCAIRHKLPQHLGSIFHKMLFDVIFDLEETLYLLDAWEEWEASMIKDDKVWLDGLPKFTIDVYNGFIELQIKRRAVLKRLRGDNAQK